ncbi:MAG TPA: type II toxin-antitoxin system VapC family toxin [Rhizomicrobium sp.]|nr:type II toxin-antitoxin system VapC family toxin [Rhizomicrobium sp.]
MIYYLDTSLLVAALTTEDKTIDAQVWISSQRPSSMALSDWVITEFSSALSVKMRTGQIDATERSIALSKFNQLVDSAFTLLPLDRIYFHTAARFADHHKSGIRAGDALHLAIASERGLTLCTLDRHLAAAGPDLGAKLLLL